jgi:MFS transporter, OFA family, oxalate/formate antiporter
MSSWQARLAQALPFYYGWVIFAVSVGVSYSARPLMAVATLSVFVVPMTEQFGWSRGLFSGAVSLGGLCAVAISPLVGRLIDRYGSGATVAAASAVAGLCAVGLSVIGHSWAFYSLYVPGRMAFASPLELGTSTALSNWFIRRRPLALVLLSVNQGAGLALMPLVAQFIIGGWGWRTAWASLGIYTLFIGVLPALLLMTRRPEDMGLAADPAQPQDPLSVFVGAGRFLGGWFHGAGRGQPASGGPLHQSGAARPGGGPDR